MPTDFPSLTKPYGMKRILRVDVRQCMREELKIERIFKNRHVQHTFEIPWATLSRTNRTTLDDFYKACRGRYLNDISFTDPWDSVAYTCRLDADELGLEEGEPTRWGANLRLVEISAFKTLKTPVATFPALSTGAVVQLPYRMSRRYRTVIEAQQDNSEKRFEDYADANGLQRWAVGGDALSDAEASALLNAWEGNNGPFRSMSFTEPETNTPYSTVHFLETECVHQLVESGVNAVRLTLEELR